MVLASTLLSIKCTILLDHNKNCGFVCSMPRLNNFLSFMAMFTLSQEPTCFMQHYGLINIQETIGGTEGGDCNADLVNTDYNKIESSADLSKGLTILTYQIITMRNSRNCGSKSKATKCPRTLMSCYARTTSWATYHMPR